jgi:hypothetical protein
MPGVQEESPKSHTIIECSEQCLELTLRIPIKPKVFSEAVLVELRAWAASRPSVKVVGFRASAPPLPTAHVAEMPPLPTADVAEMPPLPTAEVEAFQRDGWLVVRGLVDAPTLVDCVSSTRSGAAEAPAEAPAAEAPAVSVQKMCEGCGLKQASYGLASEGKKRWCAGCAHKPYGCSRPAVPHKRSHYLKPLELPLKIPGRLSLEVTVKWAGSGFAKGQSREVGAEVRRNQVAMGG